MTAATTPQSKIAAPRQEGGSSTNEQNRNTTRIESQHREGLRVAQIGGAA